MRQTLDWSAPTQEKTMTATASLDGLKVIDVDAHISEPHDLWTSRAPAAYRDRVPQVQQVDGQPHWFMEGVDLGFASAASVILADGTKVPGTEFMGWSLDRVHLASYDMGARLEFMDEAGIWAQILYPNIAGFGSQRFGNIKDPELRRLCVTLYNDAMAEIQEKSGNRILPMALIPWWDVEGTVAEVERAHGLGLRGVVTCAQPESQGAPDLGERDWDAFWATCSDLQMPVNFHIGASQAAMDWFSNAPWPSLDREGKLAVGSALIYVENARCISNMIYSGVLERFPELRVVSVESGIGWIPFILEALDYQLTESAPHAGDFLSMKPSEYFRRQVYGCFWFEKIAPLHLIDQIGVNNVMFETDFPHPTCLHPAGTQRVGELLANAPEHTRRRILQDNAAELYRIPV
jgi:predicted TIM-barrel fold metal-dependent hydrolase